MNQNMDHNVNNVIKTREDEGLKQKDNSKFMKMFKKICIILTIIVVVIAGIRVISSIFLSSEFNPNEILGPLLSAFAFIGAFIYLIGAFVIIAFIWIVYGIIKLLNNIYVKLSHKNKKIFKIVLIALLLIIITFTVFLNIYNDKNKNLAEVLDNSPSSLFYSSTSYYFIYNDKIYYYVLDNNNDYTELYDQLFVMNLDGTDNQKLVETDELRYADFYFVYNNEAYYYTMYYGENKKINLSTGEITSLGNDDNYLSKTLKDGKVYALIDHAVAGDSYAIFKKIDLDTNKTISEVKTTHSLSGNQYYLDYDGGNVYFLEDFYSEYPTIYKNNSIVYTFDDENAKDIQFIAVNQSYLYFKLKNYIYKLNVNTKQIEKRFYCSLGDIHRISSGNNSDNYYYVYGKIYEFDVNNNQFRLVVSNINDKPDYVYNINDKLIFTENTDNLKYYTSTDNLGTVLVYDGKSIERFDGIRKVSFDENYMYLLIDAKENYVVQKYDLKS